MGQVKAETIRSKMQQLGRSQGIGIRPTGWSFRGSGAMDVRQFGPNCLIYGVCVRGPSPPTRALHGLLCGPRSAKRAAALARDLPMVSPSAQVPYSEHSNWLELRDCVRTLRPRKLVPTVNAATPARAQAIIDRQALYEDYTGPLPRP